MKNVILNKNLKAEQKSDNAILMKARAARTTEEKDGKDERIKKQFAQDALIYQRIKCPVAAMVCCLICQV